MVKVNKKYLLKLGYGQIKMTARAKDVRSISISEITQQM